MSGVHAKCLSEIIHLGASSLTGTVAPSADTGGSSTSQTSLSLSLRKAMSVI